MADTCVESQPAALAFSVQTLKVAQTGWAACQLCPSYWPVLFDDVCMCVFLCQRTTKITEIVLLYLLSITQKWLVFKCTLSSGCATLAASLQDTALFCWPLLEPCSPTPCAFYMCPVTSKYLHTSDYAWQHISPTDDVLGHLIKHNHTP